MSNQETQGHEVGLGIQEIVTKYPADPQTTVFRHLGHDPATFDDHFETIYGSASYPGTTPPASNAANVVEFFQQPPADLSTSSFHAHDHVQQHFALRHRVEQAAEPIGDMCPITAEDTASTIACAAPIAGLQFANYNQAQQAFAQRRVHFDWQPPENDFTVPHGQSDREKYINQMMASIIETSGYQDFDTVESYQEPWSGLDNHGYPCTPSQMETVCWQLLDMAEKLHQQGPSSLRIYGESKFRTIYKSRKLNFAQRIHSICDLMRLSKSRCNSLLAFDDMEMTVAGPMGIVAFAKMNKKQNLKRQAHLIQGRALVQRECKRKMTTQQDYDLSTGDRQVQLDHRAYSGQQPIPRNSESVHPQLEGYQASNYHNVPTHQANMQDLKHQVGATSGHSNDGSIRGPQANLHSYLYQDFN